MLVVDKVLEALSTTRGEYCFQDLTDWAREFAFGGFPGGWVGVGSHLIHLLHPELAHQNLQSGDEWDGQEDPYKAEECAHYQYGEDYDCGMQIHGPAHYDRLEEVAFDLLDDDKSQDHPDDREWVRDQGQKHGQDDRDKRAQVGDERDQTAEDAEEQRERHPDQGERDGPENSDEGHGRELADEPPLHRVVQRLKHLSRPLPPSGGEERDEPVDPGLGPDDQVDGGDEHDRCQRDYGRRGQPHPRSRRYGAPREYLPPDPGQAFGIESDLGTEPEEALETVGQGEGFFQDRRESLGELPGLRLDGRDEGQPEEPEHRRKSRDHRQNPPRSRPPPPGEVVDRSAEYDGQENRQQERQNHTAGPVGEIPAHEQREDQPDDRVRGSSRGYGSIHSHSLGCPYGPSLLVHNVLGKD